MEKLLNEILEEIKPSQEQEIKIKKLSETFVETTNQEAKKFDAKAMIAGSLTRDTWLPTKNEFDVFIVFPQNITEKKLEKEGLKIGKKVIEKLGGKWELEYAQHPYIRGTVKDICVDIVPCYDVQSAEKIKSAVDRTPFHVRYLDKNFPKELSDDVRLLKKFLQANNIYGADNKTEGFSGYICEILVMKYGKFINVLKKVLEWKPHKIIDIENHWDEENSELLRKKFKQDVLIMIDPVDKYRNAAAAISAKNFYKFKKIAREFLQIEKKSLFYDKKIKPLGEVEFGDMVEDRGTDLIFIKFKKPDVVDDILYPQLRKIARRLESIMKDYEFNVLRSDCWEDGKEAGVLVEFEVSKLSAVNKRVGPSVFDLDNSLNFLRKYRKIAVNGPSIDGSNWYVEINRQWKTAEDKLNEILKDNKKSLEAKGIPNYIAEQISKKFELMHVEQIKKFIEKNKDFGIFLRKYFEIESLV